MLTRGLISIALTSRNGKSISHKKFSVILQRDLLFREAELVINLRILPLIILSHNNIAGVGAQGNGDNRLPFDMNGGQQMPKNRTRDSSFEEALRMSAIQAPALQDEDDDEEEDGGYGDEDEERDPDLADLNNPDIEALSEAPVLGNKPKNSDLFGQEAETFGRATSPKLYAQAAQFPSAVQFRVWRWENGIPVALGAIDAEATEEEFVAQFKDAMPKPGEGRFQFRLRPIDIRGQELGKEFTINISEHHAKLKQLRERKMREEEEERLDRYDRGMGMQGMNGWGGGRQGDIIVNPPAGPAHDAGTSYAEEMGRMFESAVESAERRTEVLQQSLEEERERLREEESRRSQERISMAERSANIVQQMTEKLMASDRSRADEALKAQRDNGQLMLSTLTTVFQQQQEAARQQTERIREVDMARMSQDREFFERQRMEMEMRRQTERDEDERRRTREREEWERRREEDRHRLEMEARRLEDQRKYELEQLRVEAERREQELERRREIEREDLRVRMERDRAEVERREREMERQREQEKAEYERKRNAEKEELSIRLEREQQEALRREREAEKTREQEREQNRLWLERERQEMARRESELERRREFERQEAERRREIEREEIRARVEREKLEAERVRQQMLEERERWRQEMEDKRRSEQMEWERKQATEREERERRERTERERWEREKMEATQRLERDRIEWERRESLRREELQREESRRRDEMMLQQKQIEIAAQRDREHAERMLEMARLEREAQREQALQREKAEREARELSEKDRQRQHELTMREMEIAKERDREHAERMLQLSKQTTGGLGGITEMLGMETPELLARIFGAGGDEGDEEEKKSGWMEVIPKVLGAVAEVGKAAMTAQAAQRMPQVDPRVAAAAAGNMGGQVAIQTPEGIKLIPASMLAQMQSMQREREPVMAQAPIPTPQAQRRRPTPTPVREEVIDMPVEAVEEVVEIKQDENVDVRSEAYKAGEEVNTIKRAKDAKISLPKQKAARKAIRELAEKLAKADEGEWSGLVTEAIMAEFAIYNYIKAVTVYAALAEAKIEPTLTERIIKALKESGMIPEDVPFTESDFERLNAAAQQTEGAE